MSTFWQTVIPAIPAALAALVAGRVAWTRTSRLQRTINTNLDLLGRLPADHPDRATLEAHNGDLLVLLVRRQERRFGPFKEAGFSLGVLAGIAGMAFMFACFSAFLASGVVPSASAAVTSPSTPGDLWSSAAIYLVTAVGFAVFAVRTAWQQVREHPPPAKQPAEAQQPAEAG